MKRALFPTLILLFFCTGAYYLFAQSRGEPKPPVPQAGPTAEDLAKQADDYRKKAEAGDIEAAVTLGGLYDEGRGVKRDENEAIHWWRMAAEKGNLGAEYSLGMIYANGIVATPDYEAAAKWLRMAADRNMRGAQLQLALLYQHGDGVKKDPVEAAFWLSLASRGAFSVSPMVRDEIMGQLSSGQKESVQKRVESWKPISPAEK